MVLGRHSLRMCFGESCPCHGGADEPGILQLVFDHRAGCRDTRATTGGGELGSRSRRTSTRERRGAGSGVGAGYWGAGG